MKAFNLLSALALITPIAPAAATTVIVDAKSDIYKADGSTSDGLAPLIIDLGNATSITFSVVATDVSVNSRGNPNDADGVGNSNGEINSGTTNFSGIKASTAGFLAGVFTSSAQRATQQTGLDFTNAGVGTNFASLSPLNYQVFFIGDGSTNTGVTQVFTIPTAGRAGSHQLVLGLTDACGYNGAPGCYGDNTGFFTINYTLNAPAAAGVPEPASWAMMLAGFGAIGVAMRRRKVSAAVKLA